MKSVISTILVLLLACSALLCFAGCTRSSTESSGTAAAEPAAQSDPVEAWKKPASVPEDAVLPSVRRGRVHTHAEYDQWYGFELAYEEADAVCNVTVGNWLAEDNIGTYYDAVVENTYKGDIPVNIVLYWWGSSETDVSLPLPTYGNRLFVFLDRHNNSPYEALYENTFKTTGSDITPLYIAADSDNREYLVDVRGAIGNANTFLDEHKLSDHASAELIAELIKYIARADDYLAEYLQSRYNTDGDDPKRIRVFDFDEVTDLIEQLRGKML